MDGAVEPPHFFSTEAEKAQDSEHDDYGADEPDKIIHLNLLQNGMSQSAST
ncbi:hypothetical protein HJB61_09375 [Rhizobium lentis]|nr:hypothetical protein [Rhizobium lentis]